MSRRITVEYVRPPIGIRGFDYCATFADSYAPGEPQGYGATRQDAIDDLIDKALLIESEKEQTP